MTATADTQTCRQPGCPEPRYYPARSLLCRAHRNERFRVLRAAQEAYGRARLTRGMTGIPIHVLNLRTLTHNRLWSAGYTTVESLLEAGLPALQAMPGFGPRSTAPQEVHDAVFDYVMSRTIAEAEAEAAQEAQS